MAFPIESFKSLSFRILGVWSVWAGHSFI
uniref:Uncharacterized protein n=1 Tax=Anguilla anguilla TaxID=7936 RepID=A0A0E9XJU4_ANGAN